MNIDEDGHFLLHVTAEKTLDLVIWIASSKLMPRNFSYNYTLPVVLGCQMEDKVQRPVCWPE